jgi:dTDP-4-amino-4,6-dideoxygalactose transaminase
MSQPTDRVSCGDYGNITLDSHEGICFGAARMAFYATLSALRLPAGSEVVLCASNCAVMVDAVLRLNLKPVFSDVSIFNYANSIDNIYQVVTPKTKVVVIQHTFGVINDAVLNIEYFNEKGIFVVEDCALSFGSSIGTQKVGSFGDAAIYSFDSTKPINGYLGGMVTTKHEYLLRRLKEIQIATKSFSGVQEEYFSILNKMTLTTSEVQSSFFRIAKFGVAAAGRAIGLSRSLSEDSNLSRSTRPYPYPALLPYFNRDQINFQLANFDSIALKRQRFGRKILGVLQEFSDICDYPDCFNQHDQNIIPLRVPIFLKDKGFKRKMNSSIIDFSKSWFSPPIVGLPTNHDIQKKIAANCPTAAHLSERAINIPCCAPRSFDSRILEELRTCLSRVRLGSSHSII